MRKWLSVITVVLCLSLCFGALTEAATEPATGEPYLDRDADFPYKIDHDDLAFQLFTAAGFEWGGDWTDRKDYQHFNITARANGPFFMLKLR